MEFGDDPEYRQMLAEERTHTSPLQASSIDMQKDMGDSTARVNTLLSQWQQEYELHLRPDGKVHTTAANMFAQWNAEDAALTPGEAEIEHQRQEDHLDRIKK